MSEYYHVDNYSSHIRVKTNAAEILEKELKKLEKPKKTLLDYSEGYFVEPRKPIIGISGGVSDSYQQLENEYLLTRKVLQVLHERRLPVFILTKSDLVLRDIDILKEINENTFANVCFSIAFSGNDLKTKLEPNSPSILARFEALKKLRKEGIRGGVIAMPIIPFIGDSLENIREIARLSKDSYAEFVLFSGMTLKPGRQKTHFLNIVEKKFPNKLKDLINCYSNNNRYGVPKKGYSLNPSLIGPSICEDLGINWLSIRHSCPEEYKSNSLVLKKLLESLFIEKWLLKTPPSSWKSYFDFTVQLERGLPEISKIISSEKIMKRLNISEKLCDEIIEILRNGSSKRIEKIKQKVIEESLSRAL
jgi:DNA repair photolyase